MHTASAPWILWLLGTFIGWLVFNGYWIKRVGDKVRKLEQENKALKEEIERLKKHPFPWLQRA